MNFAKYFSITGLVCGYWQIPLSEEFLQRYNLYQFTRVPYGLKTAGAGFIRAVTKTLNELLMFVANYVDDIRQEPTLKNYKSFKNFLVQKISVSCRVSLEYAVFIVSSC